LPLAFGAADVPNKPMRSIAKSILLVALAAPLLSGCGSEDRTSRLLVSRQSYMLFDCEALATTLKAREAREKELKTLMDKSGSEVANVLAYRPEYLEVHGEAEQLRASAAEKKCPPAAAR
jgi:hypothetical protein